MSQTVAPLYNISIPKEANIAFGDDIALTERPDWLLEDKLYKELAYTDRDAALKLYSEQEVEPHLPKDMEDLYNEIKSDFEETVCDKCKKKRVAISWYPSIDQMAATVGGALKTNQLYWYLLPTIVTHASQYGLQQHMALIDGVLIGVPSSQARLVGFTLRAAHLLVVQLLYILNSHFNLNFTTGLGECEQDVAACWPEPASPVN